MDKDIVPLYDINFIPLTVTGFKRKLSFSNFKTIYYFLRAIKRSKQIIKDFAPDIVIGVGGYVTAPVLYAAHKLKVKTFIHEQNSVVGLANKFLMRYVDRVGVSFENTISIFPKGKAVLTGNPSGSEYLKKRKINKEDYNLDKNKKLVLMVFGSLGSESVNEYFKKVIGKFKNKLYEVVFVTGKEHYDEFIKKTKIPDNVKVMPYIDNMGNFMKAVDLIVTRAGASTIAEIAVLGIPSIMIPSKYVPSNQQIKNAKELEKKGICLYLEEEDIPNDLVSDIDKILDNNEMYDRMKKVTKKFGVKDSATKIYNELFDLVHGS